MHNAEVKKKKSQKIDIIGSDEHLKEHVRLYIIT